MQIKKNQILLTVGTTKKVADIIVSISVSYPSIAVCCLKALKFNCIEGEKLVKGSEESALAYALFETVRDKLAGSALETFKTKVSSIECNSIDGHFVITFKTQATGTSLRKTCGIALSCFNTGKLFTKYSENIKFLSGKGGNKEEFHFVSKKFLESMKKSIAITAVGKLPASFDKTKLQDIANVIVTKIPSVDMPSAKEISEPVKKESEVNTYPVIKSSGLATAITADYIRNNSNGMSVGVVNDGVIIYNHGWQTKHKQLKEASRIKDYVHKKYTRLEDQDELSPMFAYYALSEGFINSEVAEKLIATKLKVDRLIELLKKTI